MLIGVLDINIFDMKLVECLFFMGSSIKLSIFLI